MADVFSKRERSALMSRVRGRGNKATELALLSLLRKEGIKGWRRGWPAFGKPDFVFPSIRLAIFVDGCFWHNCPKHSTKPVGNAEFWRRKLRRNRERDRLVNRVLRSRGWRVIRIWQHDLARRHRSRCVRRLKR